MDNKMSISVIVSH